jgi:hypothetical protein
MAETDNPKNAMILAMVIGTVASLIVVVLAIVQFFDMSVRTEVQEKVLGQQSSALRDLHAMEQDKLSHYAWVDQKAGIVRLPIDRAAELVARDFDKRPGGLIKVDDLAVPSPTTPAPPAALPAGGPAPASPTGGGAPSPATASPAAPTASPTTAAPPTPAPVPPTAPAKPQ